ncbi:zinc transporter 1-like [Tetranychus urticae]|uniref:Cation efflux protein cytoplasmic domain-containing protein n=1 Tax=Tetranychus urticae TaxID=32264 RepID=T1KI69_TETUR|nr:zinc transporter 1-like [Tetranychus urticae]
MHKIDSVTWKLGLLISSTLIYALIEMIVGAIFYSTTLIADGYHMLADAASLIVALIGYIFASRPWSKSTFGWARSEILGALINSLLLFILTGEIIVHAIKSTIAPVKIEEPKVVLGVGLGGLLFNLIGFCVLNDINPVNIVKRCFFNLKDVEQQPKLSKSTEMNLRGAALHLLGDLSVSILVVISTTANLLLDYRWTIYIDPVMAFIPAFFLSISAWKLLRESAMILLEAVPSHIQIESITKCITSMSKVRSVHEFHLWRLSGDVTIASLHCVFATPDDYIGSIRDIKHILCQKGVHSATIQPEFSSTPFNVNYDRPSKLDLYVKYCQAVSESCDGQTCCPGFDSQK